VCGRAACGFFEYRVVNVTGNDDEAAMDARPFCGTAARYLQLQCVRVPGRRDAAAVRQRLYYRSLLCGERGLLGSDQALYDDERSCGSMELYAVDEDFAGAMTRLGRIGVRMAGSGETRRA
jgi:hypothetical protein